MAKSGSGKNKPHIVKKKDRADFDKIDSLSKNSEKGRWITVNGRHTFVKGSK